MTISGTTDSGRAFADDEEFFRRISPDYYDFEKQEILSWAFANYPKTTDSISVNLAKFSSIEHTVGEHPEDGVAVITAGVCYECNQEIEHTPTDDNYSHCDVIGRKNKGVQRKLRNAAMERLVRIPKQPPTP